MKNRSTRNRHTALGALLSAPWYVRLVLIVVAVFVALWVTGVVVGITDGLV